jgi:hypothetical protein
VSDSKKLLYLLDANVLIDANRDFYPLKRVPEFWVWLISQGEGGRVALPVEQYEEIKNGKDNLAQWTKQTEVKSALLFSEEVNPSLVARVTEAGYATDLTDDEVERIGRDPFLVAYALASKDDRCVVTTEVSKPKRLRANRHIPDVCQDINVRCCHIFEWLRELDFRTDWKTKPI